MYSCPVNNDSFETAREAIVCWQSHFPSLFSSLSLAKIGKEIGGVSRERIRQIANSMDVQERAHNKPDSVRGHEAEKRRKKYSKKWKRSHG